MLAKDKFVMKWLELDVEVTAKAIDYNRKAFDWFLENLPVTALQSHAVVSGKLMYLMNIPMKSLFPFNYRELIKEDLCLEPVGRVSFFATAGKTGSIMVKYGEITEPMSYPTIAQVVEEDLEKLKEVGKTVWDSVYRTKKVIKVRFEEA